MRSFIFLALFILAACAAHSANTPTPHNIQLLKPVLHMEDPRTGDEFHIYEAKKDGRDVYMGCPLKKDCPEKKKHRTDPSCEDRDACRVFIFGDQ